MSPGMAYCSAIQLELVLRHTGVGMVVTLVRQWHHLKMLKHLGRGHDPAGILNTKEGECAVLCLACLQLGKNTAVTSSVR